MNSGLDLNQKTMNDQEAQTVCLYITCFLCESRDLEGEGSRLDLNLKNSGDQKAGWPDCMSPPPPVHTLTSEQGNEYREEEKITAWN